MRITAKTRLNFEDDLFVLFLSIERGSKVNNNEDYSLKEAIVIYYLVKQKG
jgi:hypothetical protein